MEGDTSEKIGLSDDYRKLLISISGWYDRHGYIDRLKALYRDLVIEPDKLYAATKVIELFELLRISGHLSPTDLTVLYDTINVTKPFGLEPEIRMFSMTKLFDIRTVIVSKFAPNRQSLINVVECLTDNDVKKISKLYNCKQKTNRWELFVDLEHGGRICEQNMDDFLKKITTYLIIDSNNDPLGLRKTGKSNKDSIQETTSGVSTGNTIGTQFVNCNITDSIINIVNNTIQLPATQGNAKEPTEDDVIKTYLLSTQKELCRNATRFTPATLNTRYEVDIAHMFTDLDLLKENKTKQDVKPTNLNEVLNIIKSTPACKVLIEGEGGIGKSTLLRYIAYNWATNESDETFKGKIVFLVNISSIGKGESVLDGILKQIDIEDFCLKTNLSQDSMIKRYIWNNDNDIVLLLDGLDELKDGSKSPISFFKNQNMPKCKVILTSRSDKKIDNFVKESSIHVKVKGFSAGNIRNYIKKHFHFFGEPVLGDSLVNELGLSSGYKHADINLMCKNPMLLLSICIMWEERQYLPADKADIFKEIFRTILNQFIDRHADKEQKISLFKNIPQKYVEAMLLLGKCMYNGLKRNQLSINKADLDGKEKTVTLALKLGFVYKDTPNRKSDFEEYFTAPHKLIVESLVGFYLYKLCQAAGLQTQCSEDLKRLLHPLDDSEWNIIIESEHLYISKEFAIGFLGADAGMFLNHWITNSLSTYRSLMEYFGFVKIEHRMTVEKALINYMTEENLKIMPHINDICKSLRNFIHQVIPYVEVNTNECFIHLMQRFYNIRLGFVGGIDVITHIGSFCEGMSSEEKGKMIAHILIAVPDQSITLPMVSRICSHDDIKYLIAECQKLNFKYDITHFHLCHARSTSYVVHLLSNASQLEYLLCLFNCFTGAVMNEAMRECCIQVNKLEELKKLSIISLNNFSNIDGSSLSSLLRIAPALTNLEISNCNLSGVIMNDMIRECCSQGVKLELKELDISNNNLSNIDGSLFASFFITPTLSKLRMCNCSLSGVIINDMIRKCCSQGVKPELVDIDIRNNNLNNIDGFLFVSLLGITSKLEILSESNGSSSYVLYTLHDLCINGNTPINIDGSSLAAILIYFIRSKLALINCSLSGAIMNDMIRKCFSRGVRLELKELDINGNNLRSIDGSLLSFLLAIAPKMSKLNISNCSLSGDIMKDMIRECCRRKVSLELRELRISGNNLSYIDGFSFSSVFIAFTLIILDMSNCSLSGDIMNDMTRECCSRRVNLDTIQKLNISGNNLNNTDGSSFASIFIAPTLRNLDMRNCSLSGDIMNDMIRECCSGGVKLELSVLSISGNNLSNIDGSLFASIFISPTLSNIDISNCNLSCDIVNDVMRDCCSRGVNLQLAEISVCGNNFSKIDGSSFASLFFTPTLINLDMSNCSLSGDIMNDMIRGICSKVFSSKLLMLDINGNNLSNIDGTLIASFLVTAHKLWNLNMSNCGLSGATVNDMIRECCSRGVYLELVELDINGNNLSNIDGSLLASLLVISNKISNINMSNCSLSGAIMTDMIRDYCSLGVCLNLIKLDISDNNFSSIDGLLLSSLLVIAPEISNLNMSNCCFSGAIINNMIRECCSRGVILKLKELHISDNNLSSIDGSLLTSLLVIAPEISSLLMSNCSLSHDIMNDVMRECCSIGVDLQLAELDISCNNFSKIDGSLLITTLLVIAPTLTNLNMKNCNTSGAIMNDIVRDCSIRGVKLEA